MVGKQIKYIVSKHFTNLFSISISDLPATLINRVSTLYWYKDIQFSPKCLYCCKLKHLKLHKNWNPILNIKIFLLNYITEKVTYKAEMKLVQQDKIFACWALPPLYTSYISNEALREPGCLWSKIISFCCCLAAPVKVWSFMFLQFALNLHKWSCWDQISLLQHEPVVLWQPSGWETSS